MSDMSVSRERDLVAPDDLATLLGSEALEPLLEKRIDELMVPTSRYRRLTSEVSLRGALPVLRETLFLELTVRALEPANRTVLIYGIQDLFLGVLRPRDVLRLLFPAALQEEPNIRYRAGMFAARVEALGGVTVGEVIQRSSRLGEQPVITRGTPLMEAVSLMVTRRLMNLPVVEGSEMVGMLRDRDVLLQIARTGLQDS